MAFEVLRAIDIVPKPLDNETHQYIKRYFSAVRQTAGVNSTLVRAATFWKLEWLLRPHNNEQPLQKFIQKCKKVESNEQIFFDRLQEWLVVMSRPEQERHGLIRELGILLEKHPEFDQQMIQVIRKLILRAISKFMRRFAPFEIARNTQSENDQFVSMFQQAQQNLMNHNEEIEEWFIPLLEYVLKLNIVCINNENLTSRQYRSMIRTNHTLYLLESQQIYSILYNNVDLALMRYDLTNQQFLSSEVDGIAKLFHTEPMVEKVAQAQYNEQFQIQNN